MELQYGRPMRGAKLERTVEFVGRLGLDWDEGNEFTVNLIEDGNVYATGSRQGNILKCIGVSCRRTGEGLSARIITELTKDALGQGYNHLFLYTKPENYDMFKDVGFYTVVETGHVLLMENRRDGASRFVEGLQPKPDMPVVGCIVANCNPFTNGHLYLAQKAAAACDFVHMFILSEDKSAFPADVRIRLAREGTSHIPNLAVHPTGSYLVSGATFPQYFLKEKGAVGEIQCELDIAVFVRYFAEALHISRRFVGTEPYCAVTSQYNERMKAMLPKFGIEVIEVERREVDGDAVSASRVRSLLSEGRLDEIAPLVPQSTFEYLKAL